MRLDQITVHLRRRTPWEALDLGHAMFRSWWRPLAVAWLVTYWPAAGLLVLLWRSDPEYALLVLWWLKPLFDRVLLFVCSRAAFGVRSGAADVWRELPRLLRSPGVLSGLTLRRLSLARSFLLPVWQLEEQRGAGARARFQVLGRRYRGHAVWLTFFCANMSSCLLASFVVILLLLTPADGLSLPDWFADDTSHAWRWLPIILFLLAETVIEPLYVVSGFSLYLNRRSELEGWDIELALRALAARRSPAIGAAAVLVLALLMLMPVALPAAAAAEAEQEAIVGSARSSPPGAARAAVDAVLADPVFGQEKDDWSWRWRDAQETPDEPDERIDGWFRALVEAAEMLAEALRAVVWLLVGLALAAVVALVMRYRHAVTGRVPERRVQSAADAAQPLASLPADVAAAALALLRAGQRVAALSLLYRGTLASLSAHWHCDFTAGDTESECLRRVTGRLPVASQDFLVELIDLWQRCAYGGQHSQMAPVERLIDGWPQHFGRGAVP